MSPSGMHYQATQRSQVVQGDHDDIAEESQQTQRLLEPARLPRPNGYRGEYQYHHQMFSHMGTIGRHGIRLKRTAQDE